jgi:hypothetical protein
MDSIRYELLIFIDVALIVNQVPVAIDAFFLITRSGIDYGSVSQHRPAFVWNIQDIPVTFLALFVLKRSIGSCAIFFMIIFVLNKMDDDIFDPMHGLGIEKIDGVMRGGKMTIHAIGHKPLGIIYMRGGFPGIVSEMNFVAGGTELRRRRAHHGVIADTKERKCNEDAKNNQEGSNDVFFHDLFPGRP